MAHIETDISEVAANARRVLVDNRQRGVSEWGGRAYDYVCPSRGTYPFQWMWDSCFHAIALLAVDPLLAQQELRCLLQGAQPDGFLPHMLLWQKEHHPAALQQYSIVLADPFYTATVQPPVLARAIWRVYQATKDREFLLDVLPPTMRFFRWLKAYRDPDDDHLIAIIQPDESGLDACPKYDLLMDLHEVPAERLAGALRTSMQRLFGAYAPHREDPARLLALDVFNWEDVMVNSIYADGLQCLGGLCREAGYPPAEAAEFERRGRRVLGALEDKCWDERSGVFWDLYGYEEDRAHTLTFTCLFPLILDSLDRHMVYRLVEEHLLNEREFWLPFPVPSVAACEPSFDPDYRTGAIWRGPTWLNSNFYLYWGLRAHGYRDVASELAKRTVQMVGTGGMREFFNPYTAEGQGAVDFGWSALVLDLIHAEGWLE
ncbi:MAG TPA: trehalase family glycosidase [Chloroflexota bacterium]